jgi:hypothetical protein
MQSINCQLIFDSMNSCVKKGRAYQHVDPDKTMQELEKLGILSEILGSLRNFESKLLSDMDVD